MNDTIDPIRKAQAAMQQPRPKRFYENAAVEARDGAFAVVLDGRPARTPAKKLLAVPTRALAQALADEWQAQEAVLDPRAMPLTRIVNSGLDGVVGNEAAVIDDMTRYAGSDLVCYRAGEPEGLVAAQGAAWDPILAWAREDLGARFVLGEGVMHVTQPDAAIAAVRARIEAHPPLALAGLHVMTTLTGSVLLALATAAGRIGVDDAWAAAHVDERHQERLWGEDEEALQRRAQREAEFRAAAQVVALASA